ncbi:MAG: hypothetical protein ABSD28_20330 [Tepidisphaeraceae bacterium]
MRRKTSNRKGEALAFLVVLGLGGMVALYLNQKPQVVVKTVVVQPVATEPATQEAPPVVVEAPPPPPPEEVKPVIVAAPPPLPQCVTIEAKLRDAQNVLAQDQSDLAAASKAAVDRLHQTQDYASAKADIAVPGTPFAITSRICHLLITARYRGSFSGRAAPKRPSSP